MIVRIKTEGKIERELRHLSFFNSWQERRTKLRTTQAGGSKGMKTRSSRPAASTRP